MMDILCVFSDFLSQLAVGFIFIIVSKALFEESIVCDRLNVILVLVGSALKSAANAIVNVEKLVILQYSLGIMAFLVMFFIAFRGVKKNRWKRIKAVILSFLTIGYAAAYHATVLYSIFNPSYLDSDLRLGDVEYIAMNMYLTVVCAMIVIYLYFNLVRKGICLSYRLKEIILMFVFEIAIIISAVFVYDMYDRGIYETIPMEYKYVLVLVSIISFFGFNLFLIKSKLSLYYKTGQKYQQEMLDLELRHFKQYKESQEETKRFRHDIINNLMAIQMLQSEGKNSEATDYVNELLGKVSDLSPKVVTGNDFLDCIISAKLDTMDELGIKYEIDGVLDRGLKLSLVDICTIFSNALDNAIEACEALDGNRFFKMKLKRTNSFYMIEMENSMAKDRDVTDILISKRFTTKKDKALHGYGVSNIKETVAKYNGETTIDMTDETFTLTIMLPVT